jgi:hypothetical protein
MNAVAQADIVAFARRWTEAGSHLVQYWGSWERNAASFFEVKHNDADVLHGVMAIACAVCLGDMGDVKQSVRCASPKVLTMCAVLLGHLPHFAVLLQAENNFRACELSCDYTLQSNGDKVTVRSEFRAPTEVEH